MPNVNADELITLKHKRNYIQFGGARPGNAVRYAGQDAQYMAIDGLSMSELGGIDPIYVPDPSRVGKYRLAARSYSAPDLATASIKMFERHGSIPRQLTYIGCQFNLYEATGACGDLSDFLRGWSDYVLVYSGAVVTNKDGGTRSAWDADDPVEDSMEITLSDVYPVGSLSFGEGGSTQVDREVVDITYQSKVSCGNCGPFTEGVQRIYAVTKSSGAGSPGMPAEVIYTLDGGLNWSQANISGIGATEDPVGIDVVGQYLVILAGTSAAPAYYYAELNQFTGAPGTFTKVTTGFVANHKALDIYVFNSRVAYFSAEGGYLYKTSDVPSGVTIVSAAAQTAADLKRIDGIDDTMVAVGAGGVIIKSVNRGETWSSVTTTPTISTIQAVAVLDAYRFWIGHSAGRLYFTIDGGETWTEKSFADAATGQIYDIVFATGEVGYVAYTNGTPAGKLLTTWNGGADWTTGSPRILNMPTNARINRVAYPKIEAGMAANNVALAGLAGDAEDGVILIGVAARV